MSTFTLRSIDTQACLMMNTLSLRPLLHQGSIWATRLGNGVVWYSLLATLTLFGGQTGRSGALRMALCAILGILIYKIMKKKIARIRPCEALDTIISSMTPPDKYSFPSGHTMHATAFAILTLHTVPWLGVLVVPFSLAVIASRLILGHHYPSDLIAGALIGGSLAGMALWIL